MRPIINLGDVAEVEVPSELEVIHHDDWIGIFAHFYMHCFAPLLFIKLPLIILIVVFFFFSFVSRKTFMSYRCLRQKQVLPVVPITQTKVHFPSSNSQIPQPLSFFCSFLIFAACPLINGEKSMQKGRPRSV